MDDGNSSRKVTGDSNSGNNDVRPREVDEEPLLGATGGVDTDADDEDNAENPPGTTSQAFAQGSPPNAVPSLALSDNDESNSGHPPDTPDTPSQASAQGSPPNTLHFLEVSDIDGMTPAKKDQEAIIRAAMAMSLSVSPSLPMRDIVQLIKTHWNFVLVTTHLAAIFIRAKPRDLEAYIRGSVPESMAEFPSLRNPVVRDLVPALYAKRVNPLELLLIIDVTLIDPEVQHLTDPQRVETMSKKPYKALYKYLNVLARLKKLHIEPEDQKYPVDSRFFDLLVLKFKIADSCERFDGLLSLKNRPDVDATIQQLIDDFNRRLARDTP